MWGEGMKFIDLFAGAGFIRRGMEKAGHTCVGFVEWDKFARRSYETIHDTKGEWTAHDITTVTDDAIRSLGRDYGPIQIITGGFPCQAFSIAGSRGGFDDVRGTLFFEIARFAAILRPKYLLLENVDGLRSHEEGRTLATILNKLGELDYDVQAQVLNSKDFGVPQNRERIFFVCFNRDFGTESRPQIFPFGCSNEKTLDQLIGGSQGNRVYGVGGVSVTLSSEGGGQGAKTGLYLINKNGDNIVFRGDTVNCIDANYFRGLDCHQARTGVLVGYKGPQDISNTVRTGGRSSFESKHNWEIVNDGCRIRKLTPRECWRLQGASNEVFNKAAAVNSDSQLYKQAGNGATENVIYEIARRLT